MTPSGLPSQIDGDVWPIMRQSTTALLEQIESGAHDGALRQIYTHERDHSQRVSVLDAIEDRIAKLGG